MRIVDRLSERVRSAGQPWEIACFGWIPALVVGFTAWYELRNGGGLGDLPIFRAASLAVLHGHSPYAAPNPGALAGFDTFVYPPAAAYLFAPLALVPYTAAKALMIVLGVAGVLVALRLLGVRDWRCYGLAAASAPVVNSIGLGAFSVFLLLGAAAAWRYRDRPVAAGLVGSLTATTKLFLWPLGVWLLVTRRRRATVTFLGVTVALVVAGWAAIGFAGFGSYPRLLRVLSQVEAHRSFSLVALLGVSGRSLTALSALLCAALATAVAVTARRGGEDADRRAFALAVLGALVVTPVVWLHYDVLLFVPIALYRPRFSPLWLVPLALWVTPSAYSDGAAWRIVLGLGAVAVCGAVATGLDARLADLLGRRDRRGCRAGVRFGRVFQQNG